jgi:hypothetical protein
MIVVAQQLKEIIDVARPGLLSISERRSSEKPYPDKWSIKEVLGHLIDSVANNHQRIVRMQEVSSLGVFKYTQQHWVTSQHYLEEPWEHIVELWYRYNLHLVHIVSHIDPTSLDHVCDMGYSEPAPLRFVVQDYVRHVQHHLDQIFSDVDPRERQQWVRRQPSRSSE